MGTLALTAVGATLALRPSAGAFVGAGVGVLVGLGGAALGVMGGLRRARVQEMREALLAEGNGEG